MCGVAMSSSYSNLLEETEREQFQRGRSFVFLLRGGGVDLQKTVLQGKRGFG